MRRLTIGCLLLIGRAALAQAQGSGEVATTTTPAATAASAPAEVTAPPPPEVAPLPKKFQIRAGADGAPAVFAPGVSYGANFSGRIGVQIKNRWGLYADLGGGFGFGGSISAGTGGGGVSINVSDYWRLTAMAEADIGRYFFVSFGPGVCGCTWGGVSEVGSAQGASQAAYVASGYFPELLARVGVGFGKTRHKFTLALENMVAFGKMTQVSQNASMAGADQSVRIGNLAVGWSPGIVFGWDMR